MRDDVTLGEARDWLRARVKDGARCPCCKQNVRVYERRIFSTQARNLIRVYARKKTHWCHVPTVLELGSSSDGSFAKLRYWGLTEEADDKRDDGGRAGRWRITRKGEQFILGEIKVPKFADTYNAKVLRHHGSPVTIIDALNNRFNYQNLLDGV